jgi:hypothetical protein
MIVKEHLYIFEEESINKIFNNTIKHKIKIIIIKIYEIAEYVL